MLKLCELDTYTSGAKVDKDDEFGWTLEEFEANVSARFGADVLHAVLSSDPEHVDIHKYIACADYLGLDIDATVRANLDRITISELIPDAQRLYDLYNQHRALVDDNYIPPAIRPDESIMDLFDKVKKIIDTSTESHLYFISGSAALAKYRPDLGILPHDIDVYVNTLWFMLGDYDIHWALGAMFGTPQKHDSALYRTKVLQYGPVQLIFIPEDHECLNFDIPALGVRYLGGVEKPEVPSDFDTLLTTELHDVHMRPDRYFKYRNIFSIMSIRPKLDVLVFTETNYEQMLAMLGDSDLSTCTTLDFTQCTQEQIDQILERTPNCNMVMLKHCTEITLEHYYIFAQGCSYCTFRAGLYNINNSHHCVLEESMGCRGETDIAYVITIDNSYAIFMRGWYDAGFSRSQIFAQYGPTAKWEHNAFYRPLPDH